MDPVTHIEPARIDELLAGYRELQTQFDRVRERLRRAEENKHTVTRRIYDRVRGEYDRELDSIRARMSPLRDELDRVHASLEAQCREADSVMQAVEDELAEAEFRHRTGEYETGAFADLRESLDARAQEARARQALFQATLETIAAMRRPDAPGDAPVAPPAPEVTEAPAAAPQPPLAKLEEAPGATPPATGEPEPRRPVLSPQSVAPGIDGFENPHDWITEMAPDPSRAGRRERIATPSPAPAPAPARVTKSAASAVDELDAVLAPVADRTPEYPSLVFVTGAHAGQAIALLPTTLTIGREHDNNIEIKDPDVARYHARILRERDQYVVEDLNSSTGTWVNGERKQRAVVSHGDVIRVGQTELALDFDWTAGRHQA